MASKVQPSYEDVNLCLQLFRMRMEPSFRAARSWFLYEFNPSSWKDLEKRFERNREEMEGFWLVLDYWEMAAAALETGVLNEDFFFRTNFELLEVWRKIQPLIEDLRKSRRNPTYLCSMERVARRYEQYLKEQEQP